MEKAKKRKRVSTFDIINVTAMVLVGLIMLLPVLNLVAKAFSSEGNVIAGKVLFWDKVSAYLTSRRQIMRQEMDEAMMMRAKADRLKALREQQLEEAQAKAAHIVQTAREEADALHARELVQTRREINALRAQSEAQLRALRQQEARRAAGAIADIAAAVSEKLSGKQADAALHARYVEEWLSESDDHPWQA